MIEPSEKTLEARNAELVEALREAYVILEVLRIGTAWEIAPAIKTEIAKLNPQIYKLLPKSEPAERVSTYV
jgi:hypothetical protein